MVNKESIGIDNDLTKDRNMNTFKTYCKRRKSGARFPDRKANNRLCACHCIAGNAVVSNWKRQRKKAKNKQACAERRADFTPFICSTDGAIHHEGQHFLRRLSARLASKWEMSYSRAMGFVNMRLSLAILRASVHCLRGARRKFFSLSNDSGAAIALLS